MNETYYTTFENLAFDCDAVVRVLACIIYITPECTEHLCSAG